MIKGFSLALAFCSLGLLWSEGKSGSTDGLSLTVFAAASTGDLISDIAGLYYDETGITLKINPSSSGTLARQIEVGAPADLYITASPKWMSYLIDKDMVQESRSFVRNSLVLIAPLDSHFMSLAVEPFMDLPDLFESRLSIGDPAHVPAGAYAQEALEYFQWFSALEERIQPAGDVRAALSVVELGETELGIVYATDALQSEKVKVVGVFPETSHRPIEYSIGILKESAPGAAGFYRFMKEDTRVRDLYLKYGFTPVE